MALKFVVLVACLALAQGAMVRRNAPATPNIFDEMAKHAKDFEETFSEQINSFMNSKNTKDVQAALAKGSEDVTKQFTALIDSLQVTIKDATGKTKDALEKMKQNVEHAADELKKAHPDVEKNANMLGEKMKAAVQTTLKESEKLAKEVSTNMEETNKKLAPKIKAAYEDFVKMAEEVQKKVHEAATKQ